MKKKIMAVFSIILTAAMLTACAPFTCREQGCNETEIYKDGYCKYHYGLNAGENMLKDLINNWK